MARDLTNKCKLCRRAGIKLFLKGDRCATPKCAIVKRPYAPGVHGKKSRRSRSEYGEQLAMKQKIKRIYGVLENQFKKYFKEVKDKPGITGDLLMQRLELRLDNIVYRAGFAANRRLSRQLVQHGHFKINGRPSNIPSRKMKSGDTIELKETKLGKTYHKDIKEILKGKNDFPGLNWLDIDGEKMRISVTSNPSKEDFNTDLDAQMVVEFYSR